MKHLTVLAIDLGAESGRVMAVHYDGRSLRLQELHRFPNTTVTVHGTLHWDFLRLWRDIQDGIEKGKALQPAALGIDSWGVDFGLLDSQGHLIGNPVHYRDGRTEGMMERVFGRVPKAEVFAETGIQFMPINTLYQMMSLVESRSPQLQIADTFLTAPDLLNYWLTGEKVCEFSNATTTQMLSARSGTWAVDLLNRLSIPTHILPEVVPPGTRLGSYEEIPVIAPACHDTGSAVAAVPAPGENVAYVSSGTWSLAGLEVEKPVIDEATYRANVTNEGGVYGTYRLLKNVMGLWIWQRCRATWQQQGEAYSYRELAAMAEAAEPHTAVINPNASVFLGPGDHPQHIRTLCRQSGQPVPETKGAILRAVLEGLALAYRDVLETLTAVSGRQVEAIHIVGGGSQNEVLNQMTADATGLPVIAGPIEATVVGNALVQLITLGALKDLHEARQLVARMEGLKRYEPEDTAGWDEAYARYKRILSTDFTDYTD